MARAGVHVVAPARTPNASQAEWTSWSSISHSKTIRQVARLTREDSRASDITPDGKFIVFDRLRQNSDIVLIKFLFLRAETTRCLRQWPVPWDGDDVGSGDLVVPEGYADIFRLDGLLPAGRE